MQYLTFFFVSANPVVLLAFQLERSGVMDDLPQPQSCGLCGGYVIISRNNGHAYGTNKFVVRQTTVYIYS